MEDQQAGSCVDFKTLRPFQPRQFVPEQADLTAEETVSALYRQLLDRSLGSRPEMEQCIMDRSELEAAIAQARAILYIQMTCQTDDPEKAKAHQHFIETVSPAMRALSDQLDRKMIETVDALAFEDPQYEVYFRKMRSDIEIFREENIPLQTEESLLSQQYQTVTGAMTVEFQGQERTVPQMARFYLDPDRSVRDAAWRAVAQRYLQDQETLDTIFDKMVSLRDQIARNSGFSNYRDYKFREYHRFDYTPVMCRQYHEAIELHMVPLLRAMHQRRAEEMNLSVLRPWDIQCDPLGRAALKPAENLERFTEGLCMIFCRVDPEFGGQFKMMLVEGLLDLESRKGKAPGGYQSTLYEARKPFIFGNTNGTDNDLHLLAHEGGHAFHTLACAHHALMDYRHAPMEFCEVASMSMEFLSAAYVDVFYNADEQRRWWRDKMESTVRLLIQVAIFDAFQHWLYENPSHTRAERQQQWVELNRRFGSGVEDWDGLEAFRRSQWHRVLHFFQVPFYYIEYGIAQLGALGMWAQAQEDTAAAVTHYKQALALGGSRPLPELFAAAGLDFDFSEKTIGPLAERIGSRWQEQV
jgi:oligoendopeptidase F